MILERVRRAALPAAAGLAIVVTIVTGAMSEIAQRRATVLGDLVAALSTNVPTMHVWLEEAIAGDPYVNVDRDVFAAVDRAQSITERCATRLGEPLASDARAAAERVRDLGRRARQRLDTRTAEGKIASELDQEFDAVYDDVLARTESLRVAWALAERTQLLWLRALVLELVGCAVLAMVLAVRARRLGRAVAQQNAELEERTNAARYAMGLAEDASRAKGEFLASMSHEIRTPLNAVIGFAEVLSHSKLDVHQSQQLAMMRAAGAVLLDLVNDVLDFSKIEAREVELENAPFSALDAIEDAVDVVAPQARAKGVELAVVVEGDVPRRNVGDRVRFRQVVLNLVANAVKFTDRGEVVVRLGAGRLPDHRAALKVTVHDTGTGIPEDRLARLFRPFQQADASITRERGGSGLGLSISKQLAEHMGGAIAVTSKVGVGSDFVFEVPLGLASEDAIATKPKPIPTSRALVVDGHEASRLALTQQLAGCAIEAIAASDGPSAVACARAESSFDLLFVDDRLGPELVRELGAFDSIRGAPVVWLVSTARSAALQVDSGEIVTAMLLKPVRRSRLEEVLDSLAATLGETSARWNVASTRSRITGSQALPKRVLVVDDNAVNLELARALFITMGVEVVTATSSSEALEEAHADRFDLVLLDLHMPVVDGASCARAMKARLGARCPRLVALTADVTVRARQACKDAGFEAVLTKPVAASALRGLLTASPTEVSDGELDPTNLEILFSSDAARARRTCVTFVETATQTEQWLIDACAAGDHDTVVTRAHALIGAAGSIGAIGLHAALRRLEAAARANETGNVSLALQEVSEKTLVATRAVEAWVNGRGPLPAVE